MFYFILNTVFFSFKLLLTENVLLLLNVGVQNYLYLLRSFVFTLSKAPFSEIKSFWHWKGERVAEDSRLTPTHPGLVEGSFP